MNLDGGDDPRIRRYSWAVDNLNAEPHGRGMRNNPTGMPQYLNWLARLPRRRVPAWALVVARKPV